MTKKHTLLRLCLAAAMVLSLAPLQAFADQSTTTIDDAAKDKSPNTEIYAVTKDPGSDYPYYGAKHEPKVGVYYGRTCEGGTKPNGQYGLANEDQMAGESAVGFYYTIDPSYSLEYWSYLYGPAVNDGSRAFMVYINFDQGAADCTAYANGQYDSILTQAFSYLSTLKNPVFVRIGGEMNLWATPQAFIPAFQHVADLAHRTAPNVATVFSPNFSSAYMVDMDTFYPGDAYVDWIGVSLYYDTYHSQMGKVDDKNARFLGVGQYGDALLNVQQAVNLSRIHKKPLMATEGGSANTHSGQDISAEAAARMEKAFAFLPMVYPELKCIISSDYSNSWEPNGYKFSTNPTVTAAYRKAVASNPTYLDKVGGSASYYTKLSAYTGTWSGKMKFAAYTYTPPTTKPTATWSVDGQTKATVSEYPYAFELDVSALGGGQHTLAVTFDNGQTKSYSFTAGGTGTTQPTDPTTPTQPTDPTTPGQTADAMPTNDKLMVNGVLADPTVYKIDGSNYFKIRDLAAVLNGTKCQFGVGYDGASKSVTATTGQSYVKQASDLAGAASGNQTATISNDTIIVNGAVAKDVTVYKIDGSNYFKLRDLGKALGFPVDYDPAVGMIINTEG